MTAPAFLSVTFVLALCVLVVTLLKERRDAKQKSAFKRILKEDPPVLMDIKHPGEASPRPMTFPTMLDAANYVNGLVSREMTKKLAQERAKQKAVKHQKRRMGFRKARHQHKLSLR